MPDLRAHRSTSPSWLKAAYPDAEIPRPAAPVERKPALSTRTGKLIVEPSKAFFPLGPAGILLCQRCHNRPSGDELLTSGGCLPHLSERYADFRMHHCQVELPAGIAGVGFGEAFEDRQAIAVGMERLRQAPLGDQHAADPFV